MHIGDNVVVGTGSVVTRDLPDNVIAVGNPCRVLREITEEDRSFIFEIRNLTWMITMMEYRISAT